MFRVAVVGVNPLVHRLADVPRGIVPDEKEARLSWTAKCVASHARKAQVTAPRDVPAQSARAFGGLSANRVHNRQGLCLLGPWPVPSFPPNGRAIIAPGMHLRLGFTAPPYFIFEAKREVRMVVAKWIRRSRCFFSLVGRVGTDDPVFGALPTDPQPDHGIQQGRTGESGVAQALLMTDCGQQFECPRARWFAKGARTLVQDHTYLLSFLSVKHGLDPEAARSNHAAHMPGHGR